VYILVGKLTPGAAAINSAWLYLSFTYKIQYSMTQQTIAGDTGGNQRSNLGSIIILGAFFFIFGFVTWLNSILIPYLKIACELTDTLSYLVALAFYISYFVMAIPSSWVLKKTGFKRGMMVGLLVMSAGALIFIPAAMSRTYSIFLVGLFVIGTGLTLLQTAVNPYVTILGPIESAAKRISIMGICNKIAGVLGTIVLGAVLLFDGDQFQKELATLDGAAKALKLDELANRAIMPYLIMAVILAGLALMVKFSSLPEIESEDEEDLKNENISEKSSVLAYPNLVLGVIALFLYVGVEVIAGDTIGNYGLAQGFGLEESKNLPRYTLTAMVIGYLLGLWAIPRYIKQQKALAVSAVLGVLFSLAAIFSTGYTSVFSIALLGFANAMVWPAIWPLAIHGLGKFTKIGSAMLIMAIIGGAILILIYGFLSEIPSIGHRQAYWILVPCYLFMLFYSVKGYKLRNW
jgi:FHS family L-fucose permease-like MFS transporter